jgi:hypothetical protein
MSASYTQTDSTSGSDTNLDTWYGVWTPQRRLEASGTKGYGWAVAVYGQNIEFRVTRDRFNHDGTVTAGVSTLTGASTGTNSEWVIVQALPTESSWHSLGSTANELATFGCYFEFQRPSGPAVTASLYSFAVYEYLPTSTHVPTS